MRTRELLVLGGVTLRAVMRRERFRDREPTMLHARLALGGVMAVEAGHALRRMLAALELLDDGRRLAPMAFGAFAGHRHERGGGIRHDELSRTRATW